MNDDVKMYTIALAAAITVILGVGAEIVWSNHDTNIRYNNCEQAAAKQHVYANCPAHLISLDPITWPSQGNN